MTFKPNVNSWEVYEDLWWKWWCHIQPGDRPIIDGRPSFVVSNTVDWEEINVWGQNGLALVVVALAWWGKPLNGRALNGQNVSQEESSWMAAVRDVTWVLWELTRMVSKRNDEGPEGTGSDDEDGAVPERTPPLSPTRGNKRPAAVDDDDDLEDPLPKRTRLDADGGENTLPHAVVSPRRTRSRRA